MIFKRRDPRSWGGWAKDLVAPRKGWRRGFRYIGRRVQRLPDTPHRIALGFACGAMASFTPFFTLHAFVAALLAYMARGNVIAGVFGTVVGNPLTGVPIAAVSLQTGNWLLGRTGGVNTFDPTDVNALWTQVTETPLVFLESVFTPYLIGGILPGLVCATAFYVILRPLIAGFQDRRRDVLAARAQELVRLRAAKPDRIEHRVAQRLKNAERIFETQLGRLRARRATAHEGGSE
ncbi:MAG: DUF2062 domain-containing protein [Neomegalonema sp.]|nr:DUF2062 domain-containing protein [Neomegalonema sp.]